MTFDYDIVTPVIVDQMCPNFPIRCINDGYVSYINNTCKCRCPTGMDERTGCATPTMAGETLLNKQKPIGINCVNTIGQSE